MKITVSTAYGTLLSILSPSILSMVCLFGSLLRAEDWPQWRGPRADSSWRGPAVATALPAPQLPQLWKVPIGPGFSGISVSDGRVYTMDRPRTPGTDGKPPQPSDTERLVCLSSETGGTLWEHRYPVRYGDLDYGKGPRCTPTIHSGRVYTLGAVGHLHCCDARSGQVIWSRDLVKDFQAQQPTWGFAASPVIHRDLVIIHASTPGGAYLAFDAATGQEKWRGGPDPTGYGTPLVIHRDGRDELVGWTPEHILGLSLPDGRELWRVPYKVTYGVSIATPLYQEGLVVVCGYWEGSKAIRLGTRPQEAQLAWEENRFLRGLMAPPLYRDGHVFLLDKQHGVVCFELATGTKKWTDDHQLTKRDRNPQVNLVWLNQDGSALALNAEGELIHLSLSPAGLKEHWRTPIVGPTWAHFALADHRAFARDDEQLVCVQLPTMK